MIEVNRDLTVEQLEIIDNALRQVGLVKTTRVMFHNRAPHPAHRPRAPKSAHPIFRIGHDPQSSPVSNR
ncbi:MAG TPA: hypothetical protein VE955_08220 [Candidatus Dormibacteraeota bacterium]|nr:hypothetical protein [Candidatus Dormibacteraeota bacterium]